MNKTRWEGDAIDALVGWWAEGKSAGDISSLLESELAFHATRNAVLGKLNRLGKLGNKNRVEARRAA